MVRVERRELLGGLATTVTASVAGCSSGDASPDEGDSTAFRPAADGPDGITVEAHDGARTATVLDSTIGV
jgi:hypothetical protein